MADNIPFSLRLIRTMYRVLGPLLPERFGKLAYETWFSTTRFRTPDRERPVLASAEITDTDVFGLPVKTYSWGQGERSVLFIHGWSGRGTQVHTFVEPLVKSGFRVISFDGPAHGASPGEQTSVLQLADALLALQERHGPFHSVITHSFGGMVLAFATRYGFTVERAVCICPAEDFDRLIDNFTRVLDIPDVVRDSMLRRLHASHGDIIRTMINTEYNAAQIDFPALIIHDRDDPEIPWQGSERIAQAWKDSELMLTDGLKHHRILRDDAVVQATVDYLKK